MHGGRCQKGEGKTLKEHKAFYNVTEAFSFLYILPSSFPSLHMPPLCSQRKEPRK